MSKLRPVGILEILLRGVQAMRISKGEFGARNQSKGNTLYPVKREDGKWVCGCQS